MGGAVSALVVFGVLILVGAPVALSLPGPAREWTGLVFEALVIGVVVEMFVAIVLLHAGHYSSWTALLATLVIVGAATIAIRRFSQPPDLAGLRYLEAALIGLGTLVFVLVALRIRHAPSYFIFQTGDMGGYVNTANILRRSGGPYGTQPQGFTLFLRETNLLLGRANTVAGLPALGAALLLGAVSFARTLRLHLVAAIGIAVILLVHPVAVWFSLFPVSEALFAVLLLALFYFVLQTRATGSTAYALIAGLVAGALLVVRGEAVLLAPILTLLLLASIAVDGERTARVQLRFTMVALVTLIVAYAYDVTYAHIYFRGQLRHLMPHFASRFAERAKLEHFSVALVLAGALAVGLVLGLTWIVRRYARPHLVGRPPMLFWRYAYGAVVAIGLLALVTFHLHGLADTWARWGFVLLVLVAIGGIGVLARPGRYLDAACGFLLLMVMAVFVVLFARRVPDPKIQTYYLYFDRYLFSEVLPAALPLAAIGIQMTVAACTRFAPARVAKVAIAAVIVLIVVGVVPQVHETQRITKYRLLGHSYDALNRIDELTRTNGTGAVVYSGTRTRPKQWFYPNTYRAFALPLRQSFDRQVFGIPNEALGKDDVFTPTTALAVLQANHQTSGYLVKLRQARRHLPDDGHTKWLGSVGYISPLLGQRTHKPAAPWRLAHLRFDVYALS